MYSYYFIIVVLFLLHISTIFGSSSVHEHQLNLYKTKLYFLFKIRYNCILFYSCNMYNCAFVGVNMCNSTLNKLTFVKLKHFFPNFFPFV